MLITNRAHLPVAFAILAGDISLADVDGIRAFYRALHAEGRRFASIVDGRRVGIPPATVRRALADMSNEFEADAKRNLVGMALILDSPLLVGSLRAVTWLLRMELPMRSFTTPEAALAWVDQRLRAEGSAAPPGAAQWLARLAVAAPNELRDLGG